MRFRTTAMVICTLVVLALMTRTADGDELRNVKQGGLVPPFSLPQLDGSDFDSSAYQDRAVILVYLAALQRRSERAADDAYQVYRSIDDSGPQPLLLFVTTDADQQAYFRDRRAAQGEPIPLLLDAKRSLYGDLGLVVLPTTIVIGADGRLAHVISSHKPDYRHVLHAQVDHTLGRIDDQEFRDRLTATDFDRDHPEQQIARHRAAARTLRASGLVSDAENELLTALTIHAGHPGTLLDLAALSLALGRVDEASSLTDTVLADDPDHLRARLIHGVILYRTDRLDDAESVLSSVLALTPEPALAHYYLSLIYERKGETARALKHSKTALSQLIHDLPL